MNFRRGGIGKTIGYTAVKSNPKTSLQLDPFGPPTDFASPNFCENNLIEAEEKFGIADPVEIDEERLQRAIDKVVSDLKAAGITTCRALSAEEAVFGSDKVYPMNLLSSAGYPYRGKKKKWVVENEDYKKLLDDGFNSLEDQPMRDPATIAFKDEIRPLRKNGKPRAFVIMGFKYIGVARMLAGEMDAKIADNLATTGIGIGHNYLQGGWQTLLNRHGRKKYHTDADYENWDGKLPPALIRAICIVRKAFMPEKYWNKLDHLYMDLAFCPLIYHDGSVRMRFGGIPSGHASTATDNSIANLIALRYAVGDEPILSVYGDDNIISTDQRLVMEHIVQSMRELGMTFTGADKGTPRWKELDQVEFLKFSTIVTEDGKWYAYREGLDRVRAILSFRKESTVEHFIARARMAYMLAYNHPQRHILFMDILRMTQSYVSNDIAAANVFDEIVNPFFHTYMMRGVHLLDSKGLKDANVEQNIDYIFGEDFNTVTQYQMAPKKEVITTTTKVVGKPKGQRPPRGRRNKGKGPKQETVTKVIKEVGPSNRNQFGRKNGANAGRNRRTKQLGGRAHRGIMAQLNANVMHSSSTNFIVEACSPWEQMEEMTGIPDGIGGSVIVQRLVTTQTAQSLPVYLQPADPTAEPPTSAELDPTHWNLLISQSSLPGVEYMAMQWKDTITFTTFMNGISPTFGSQTPWGVFTQCWANQPVPAVRFNNWIPLYVSTSGSQVIAYVYFAQDPTVKDIESIASRIRLIGRSNKSVMSASALHNEGMAFFCKHPMEKTELSPTEDTTLVLQLMKLGFKTTPEMMALVSKQNLEVAGIHPEDLSQASFSDDEEEVLGDDLTTAGELLRKEYKDARGGRHAITREMEVKLPTTGTKRAIQLRNNLRTETINFGQVILGAVPSTPTEMQNFDRNGFTSHPAKRGGLVIATFAEPITGQEMNADGIVSSFLIGANKQLSGSVTGTPLFQSMPGFNHYWDTVLYEQISKEASVTISTNAFIEFVPALDSQVASYASKSAVKDDMALKFVANIQRSIKHGFDSNANDGGGLFGWLESAIRKIPIIGDIAGGVFGGLRGTASKLAFG